jgi:hypothetical protein
MYINYDVNLRSAYNASNATYDALRAAYDEKAKLYYARQTNDLKKALQEEVLLPQKPCPPIRPPPYNGPKVTFDITLAQSIPSYINGRYALIVDGFNQWGGTKTMANYFSRVGFLQANIAESASVAPVNVGHIMGRMGQGERTTPDSADFQKPFSMFADTKTTVATRAMMISILPMRASDQGL